MEVRTWESEPWEWDKGVNAAQPPGPPLPTWGPHPARPPPPHPGSQLPRFSSRREKREGERQGCACLLLPPLPSAGPFPSRQETSPDSQPAAALPAPPLHPRPTESHSPGRLAGPCGSAPALRTGPQRPGLSRGGPSPQAPPSWSRGLAPHSPTLATGGVACERPDKGPVPEAH